MAPEMIRISQEGKVQLIRLNRPDVLNALNNQLVNELVHALQAADNSEEIAVSVITGSQKAFAAGADIDQMVDYDFPQAIKDDFLRAWEQVAHRTKPVIAAVQGFALGGGCELAMMCDMIIAGQSARFGQPEIKLGIIPGAGGTQRLVRALGKAKAMDLILTARMMSAEEAEKAGLVARIVEDDKVVEEAMSLAQTIASMPGLAVRAAKQCVQFAHNSTLDAGCTFERGQFYALFATRDQKEGMKAFLDKRKPDFQNG
jgi:enoyl-CoA hydratase